MLVIVMHNNREYLDLLKKLSIEKGINAVSIVKGSNCITSIIFSGRLASWFLLTNLGH